MVFASAAISLFSLLIKLCKGFSLAGHLWIEVDKCRHQRFEMNSGMTKKEHPLPPHLKKDQKITTIIRTCLVGMLTSFQGGPVCSFSGRSNLQHILCEFF